MQTSCCAITQPSTAQLSAKHQGCVVGQWAQGCPDTRSVTSGRGEDVTGKFVTLWEGTQEDEEPEGSPGSVLGEDWKAGTTYL